MVAITCGYDARGQRPSQVRTWPHPRRLLGVSVRVIDDLLDFKGPLGRQLLHPGYDDHSADMRFYLAKMVSVVMSSFGQVLFMDADNMALRDPTPLFGSAPMQATGALFWPDHWGVSSDPAVVRVLSRARERMGIADRAPDAVREVDVGVPDFSCRNSTGAGTPGVACRTVRVRNARHKERVKPQSEMYSYIDFDRAWAEANFMPPQHTHETGQLLIDKARHWDALMLALFIQAYPSYTIAFLIHDRIGQGDKENFAWAVTVMGGDYFVTDSEPGMIFAANGDPWHTFAHVGVDGLLSFAHTARPEWDCKHVPRRLDAYETRWVTYGPPGKDPVPLARYLKTERFRQSPGYWPGVTETEFLQASYPVCPTCCF